MLTSSEVAMTSENEHGPMGSQTHRKQRPQKRQKGSIYLKSEPAPYTLAIKPQRLSTASARSTPASGPDENGAESSQMAEQAAAKSERRRLAAMKAWETKRRKQRERFEALESGLVNKLDTRDSDSMDPLLAHLFVPDDTPKDDLLEAIHAYTSSQYTKNGILLPPKGSGVGLSTQVGVGVGVHETNDGSQAVHSDEDEAPISGYGMDNGDNRASTPTAKRKRGGPKGKRKMRDMWLALDGSALLTLGTLVQEMVIAGLKDEGYKTAESPVREVRGDTFRLSDSDDDDNDV